jgi:hypothetical protein
MLDRSHSTIRIDIKSALTWMNFDGCSKCPSTVIISCWKVVQGIMAPSLSSTDTSGQYSGRAQGQSRTKARCRVRRAILAVVVGGSE